MLGWDRGADLLSGLIPQIHFDYLRGGPPEQLVPVLNHNQMDLRGLAVLSRRTLSLLSDAENLGRDVLELFGVSRICVKRGECTRARKLYERSIASFWPMETDRAARCAAPTRHCAEVCRYPRSLLSCPYTFDSGPALPSQRRLDCLSLNRRSDLTFP